MIYFIIAIFFLILNKMRTTVMTFNKLKITGLALSMMFTWVSAIMLFLNFELYICTYFIVIAFTIYTLQDLLRTE